MEFARVKALVEMLADGYDEITEGYDSTTFEVDSEEYMVLTDSEADEKATEYIKESVWAFNADFIASHSKIDYDATVEIVTQLKEKCEDANDAIMSMIEDFDEFVEDAISADGRGHFLNNWDGSEEESGEYFIYRVN
jgi:hypothetical protein